MRVQAKRLSQLNVLKIRHKVKSSGEQQRKLLIDNALADGMKPVYCIYSSECQRTVWKRLTLTQDLSFESGCLLADAENVPLHVTKLRCIEPMCIPWHHLMKSSIVSTRDRRMSLYYTFEHIKLAKDRAQSTYGKIKSSGWNYPTIDDLNEDTSREYDRTGVVETRPRDIARFEHRIEEDGRIAEDEEIDPRETGIAYRMFVDIRREHGTVEDEV
ncbi:MAG: hypothetical protein F4Y03_02550 [Alphaproteobacteria bacterium]|nr:hypothetical protein [Alphaproteobacteria bacterium]